MASDDSPSDWPWQPPPPSSSGRPHAPAPSAPPLPPDYQDRDLYAPGSAASVEPQHLLLHDQPQNGVPRRPIDYIAAQARRLWRTSYTVLRLDIRQAIRLDGPVIQSREVQRHGEGRHSQGWFQGIQGGGAQLKLMQVWDFSDKDTGQPTLPWNINFGLGAKIELDKARLEPLMRLESKHVGFHVLPYPFLELHGKWPLGGTSLAINLRYRLPLLQLAKFWESPAAQLCLNLYNPLGTGFHLTPGGIEFDEHAIRIGENTKLRVAASIIFPRQFPLEEGEQPMRVQINRLGLKARFT